MSRIRGTWRGSPRVARRNNLRVDTQVDARLSLGSAGSPVPTEGVSLTIFQKIIDREIPADIVYEDDQALAFRDINPQAPTHVLVIPKRAITSVATATKEDSLLLGHLLWVAAEVAREVGLDASGYRLNINHGDHGGQTVHHVHVHLLGGRPLGWPPG